MRKSQFFKLWIELGKYLHLLLIGLVHKQLRGSFRVSEIANHILTVRSHLGADLERKLKRCYLSPFAIRTGKAANRIHCAYAHQQVSVLVPIERSLPRVCQMRSHDLDLPAFRLDPEQARSRAMFKPMSLEVFLL